MSDEKRTISVDGLNEESVKAIQESIDACRSGKNLWIMEDETYDEKMDKSFNRGSMVAFITTSIVSACMAVYVANEDKIKDGFAKAIKFVFGKK